MSRISKTHVTVLRAAVTYGLNGLPSASTGGGEVTDRVGLPRAEFNRAAKELERRGLLTQQAGRWRVTDPTLSAYPRDDSGDLSVDEGDWIAFIAEAADACERV